MTYSIKREDTVGSSFSIREMGYVSGLTPISLLNGEELGQSLAYKIQEGTGTTVYDLSNYKRNGTIVGDTPTWNNYPDNFTTVTLNGTNNAIKCLNTTSILPDVGSWYLGILFKKTVTGVNEYVLSQRPSATNRWYIRINTSNVLELVVNKDGASALSTTTIGGNVGAGWHLVIIERRHKIGSAINYSKGRVVGWLDGKDIFTSSPINDGGFAQIASDFVVGGNTWDNGQFLKGEIGCVFSVSGQSLDADGVKRLTRHFDNVLKIAGQGGISS